MKLISGNQRLSVSNFNTPGLLQFKLLYKIYADKTISKI